MNWCRGRVPAPLAASSFLRFQGQIQIMEGRAFMMSMDMSSDVTGQGRIRREEEMLLGQVMMATSIRQSTSCPIERDWFFI